MQDSKYLKDLQMRVQLGEKLQYLCFWGHSPKHAQLVDKSCFSQWFPSRFELDGIQYQSAEQYMMAQKAQLFADHDVFAQIIKCSDPKQVKALGRLVKNYDEAKWLQHRFDIVVQGNLAKFSQNTELKAFLLSTSTKVLVEASPVDKIWGVGLAAEDQQAENPLQWRGLNLLGFALIQVRAQLLSA
ncbi:hypothetical protein EC844_11123 [Acinetobacter calcoaceticus]|uniref:NADAR domain-containing protein n=1 Tax=Acinetobacter calcoaceticus TaxID=471 RepID=A0A4R1XR23_ACICA|nr:hypothetical protein EC844_11123 [Acinetobacter calcoaceticus]